MKDEKAEKEKLRAESKPSNGFEILQRVGEESNRSIGAFNKNSHSIKEQFNVIADALCQLLGRVNLVPLEKTKSKDKNGKLLL